MEGIITNVNINLN